MEAKTRITGCFESDREVRKGPNSSGSVGKKPTCGLFKISPGLLIFHIQMPQNASLEIKVFS